LFSNGIASNYSKFVGKDSNNFEYFQIFSAKNILLFTKCVIAGILIAFQVGEINLP